MLTFFVELVWLHATLQNPTTRQGRTTSLLIGVCFKFVELWGLFNFICLSVDTNMNIIIYRTYLMHYKEISSEQKGNNWTH